MHRNLIRKEAEVESIREAEALVEKGVQLTPEQAEVLELDLHRKSRMLSANEKAIVIQMFHAGASRKAIARAIDRKPDVIAKFLSRYTSTVLTSKLYFQANADKLARRVIREANVEESLEVLDRLDVLAKKTREAPPVGPQFNVFVGMPSRGNGIPSPSQADVIEAQSTRSSDAG